MASAHADPSMPVEDSYFGELPVVLSVTRLAQSLADTPGAVSIIDREMIRKSGAREITELLRFFVPGFVVGHIGNGANPTASYHAVIDTYGGSRHMQVFIDGRSVYSSLFVGDTHRGLMGVILEDVERIEVLRGSNSASDGGNAFLGVINIITRNSADTHGAMVSATSGDRGVKDNAARVGWGNEAASFRISAARRADKGTDPFVNYNNSLEKAYDNRIISQMHFRSDIRPSANDDVLFELGQTSNASALGSGSGNNPLRTEETTASYVQARWIHEISAQESISFKGQFDQEERLDQGRNAIAIYGTSGNSQRQHAELQHTRQYSDEVRAVWGLAWRHEMARGKQIFLTEEAQTQMQRRLFGNLEWRPAANWVINAGGMYEDHSVTGTSFSPRLMLNYHLTPEHTFRGGATRSNRNPTLFESRAKNYAFFLSNGLPAQAVYVAQGGLKPETVNSRELGYFGNMARWNLNIDVRAFWENIHDLVTQTAATPYNFQNTGNTNIKGIEQQWKWRPREGTQFLFNHAYTRLISAEPRYEASAPRVSYSGAWFQQLPAGFDFSLMYSHVQEMSFGKVDQRLPAYGQIDMRLGYPFRIGITKAEAAFTTQAANGSHLEYTRDIQVTRRSMATLRLEF